MVIICDFSVPRWRQLSMRLVAKQGARQEQMMTLFPHRLFINLHPLLPKGKRFADMEITEKWIAKAAGWKANKAGRDLFRQGAVIDSSRKGNIITGTLRSGGNTKPTRVTVKIHSDTDILWSKKSAHSPRQPGRSHPSAQFPRQPQWRSRWHQRQAHTYRPRFWKFPSPSSRLHPHQLAHPADRQAHPTHPRATWFSSHGVPQKYHRAPTYSPRRRVRFHPPARQSYPDEPQPRWGPHHRQAQRECPRKWQRLACRRRPLPLGPTASLPHHARCRSALEATLLAAHHWWQSSLYSPHRVPQ